MRGGSTEASQIVTHALSRRINLRWLVAFLRM